MQASEIAFDNLPQGYAPQYTYAVAADGQSFAGGGEAGGITHRLYAFRWTSAGHTDLGNLAYGYGDAAATDISADGSVIVGWSESAQSGALIEPFRWTASTGMVGLGVLSASASSSGRATAVSADGQVVVGWTTYYHDCGGLCGWRYEPRAFRWTVATGLQALPLAWPATSTETYAHAVSPDGSVVLGTDASGSGYFVWSTSHGLEDLSAALGRMGIDTFGWTLSAIAVLRTGSNTYLTGYGRYQSGSPVVWRAAFD